MLVMVLVGTFHKTYARWLLGNVPLGTQTHMGPPSDRPEEEIGTSETSTE